MLIVDGVEYKYWTPSSEEELETIVEGHSKRIFGEDSLYFSVKTKLKSIGGVGSIPDGYVLTLSKPRRWFIVEVELSKHPIFNHIVPQLNKFVQGIRDPNSRKSIVRALYDEIMDDTVIEAYVKKQLGTGEIYRFLSDTVDRPPTLVVVIDEKTRELEEACESIPIDDKRVVEFKVYERVDAEIKNAFLFEPITEKPSIPRPSKVEITPRPPLLKGRLTPPSEYEVPILESLIELGGSGRVRDVLDKVYEKMKVQFISADLEKLSSGRAIRWKNRAMWVRMKLKTDGYLKADSPRGIWEITEKGRARALEG